MKEIWLPMKHYEDKYECSSFGRIRSFFLAKQSKESVLRMPTNNRGYCCVTMWDKNKKRQIVKYAHRLIAETFISNPKNKLEINHKDACKTNNNISNLEWVSRKENAIHASHMNLLYRPLGELAPSSKLNNHQVNRIRLLKKMNPAILGVDLSKIFGVTESAISNIINKRTWKHI